jgi:hypothetical protein
MARRRVTARQRAASKRNLVKARSARSRRKRRIVAGGVLAVGAVAGGAYVAHDRKHNVRLYHNTDRASVRGIKRSGFRGANSDYASMGTQGRVYFSVGKNHAKAYGSHTVRVKMSKVKYRSVGLADPLAQSMGGYDKYGTVHTRDLKGHRVRRVARMPRGVGNTAYDLKQRVRTAHYHATYKRRR